MKKHIIYIVAIFVLINNINTAIAKDPDIINKTTNWDTISSLSLSNPWRPGENIFYQFGVQSSEITYTSPIQSFNLITLDDSTNLYSKSLNVNSEEEGEIVEGFMGKMKLLTALLNEIFPQGPSSIKVKTVINLKNEKNDLRFNIDPEAVGIFGAPWSAQGYIKPLSKNKFEYYIVFKFIEIFKKTEETKCMAGELDYSLYNFTIPDSFNIQGYQVVSASLKPDALLKLHTIGEVRKYLKDIK